MNELLGLLIGFGLTLCIYSYLLGDNPLFRLASHVLVGVSAAYAAVVAVEQVLLPVYGQIRQQPTAAESLLWWVPIGLGLLLLLKRLPVFDWLGSLTLALLVGIGAAVALVGALLGTVWPQVWPQVGLGGAETAVSAPPLEGLVLALLTIITLLSFQYYRRPNEDGEIVTSRWQQAVAAVGQGVLMVTFGALFANLLTTGLALLAAQLDYFWQALLLILS